MAAASAYGIIAYLCAFAAAAFAAPALLDAVRSRSRARVLHAAATQAPSVALLARNGVRALAPLARRVLAWRPMARWCDAQVAALDARGYEATRLSVCTLALGMFVLLVVVATLLGIPLAGVGFGALTLVALNGVAARTVERRHEAIRDALPDAMRTMSACFHAGFSLKQTFIQLAREAKPPLSEVFSGAADELETGATANEALECVRAAGDVSELAFLSVALEVQHQSGGSMQHVLDAARESLENELELVRSLRVHTAQARLSARVVVGVSIGMVAMLSLLSPDFMAPFAESATGAALLALAVAMQAGGIIAVRRMLNVEVR